MDLEPVSIGRGRGARSAERETGRTSTTEGLLPVDAVMIEADRPAARAARLDDKIQTGTTAVRILDAHRLGANRLHEAVGDDSGHGGTLSRGVKG